jgi:hypothetical protein
MNHGIVWIVSSIVKFKGKKKKSNLMQFGKAFVWARIKQSALNIIIQKRQKVLNIYVWNKTKI